MPIKRLLVPVQGDESDDGLLRLAATIARPFEATIDALHVRPDPAEMTIALGEAAFGMVAQQIVAAAEAEGVQRAQAARRRYEAWREEAGVSSRWSEAQGSLSSLIGRLGRLADLIVLNRAKAEAVADLPAAIEVALVDTGRPVLLAPGRPLGTFCRHVGIAWNGSTESSRAVACVMPFLERAGRITVFAATPDDSLGEPGEALIAYLHDHGFQANLILVPANHLLIETAVAAEVDFLALGAYSHSRLHRLILGGVTRHVLADDRLAALMVH